MKIGKLSEVKIEELKRKLRYQRLEPDHTTLASQIDGNNTRRSYIPEVTQELDVDVNVDEKVHNN